MFGKKKIIIGLVGALTLGISGQALAQQQDLVMMKIHDIVPIKNEKGETTTCEFFTTIYNRTSMNMTELTINLDWFDQAVDNVITQEKSNERILGRREVAPTEEYTSSNVSTSLSIPTLQVNSQKTMKGRINSDRCFLLTQEPKINISSCETDNPNDTNKSNSRTRSGSNNRGNFSCGALFSYISPKDPQYYTDFMTVTIEEQDVVDKKALERQGEELDSMFKSAEVNMNRIIKLIDTSNNAPMPAPVPAPVTAPTVTINPTQVEITQPEPVNVPNAPEKTYDLIPANDPMIK